MPAYQFGVPASLFAPADLLKVVCWLDAGHPPTVKRASGLEAIHGSNVVTWTSRVGVGIDFSEVSGSGPVLVADGSGPNARRFLRFNGTSQYLRYLATDPFATETGELWMLVKSDSAATGVTFGTADQSITTRYWYASVAASGEWEYWWDEAETADAQRNRTRANHSLKHAWYLVRYFSDGTTTNIEIDGVTEPLTQILTGGNTGSWFADATQRDNVTVGAIQRTSTASYFAGDLAEVIVCSALLTDAEAAQLRAYFRIKYGPIYRVAALGDSLTLQPSGYADELAIALGTSCYAMGVADHGVGSEELDDIYARWVANTRGQGFERLVLLGGTNNTKNAHGPQIEFYDQILSEAIADQLGVVTITVPPFGSYVTWSPANQVALETLNAHIRTAFVDDPQVAFVELHDRIRNPANYAFLPEYNGDNLHLSNVADVLPSELVRDALISIA